MIDFTNCPENKFKHFRGVNGSKISIVHNNENYMLKFPPEAKRNTEISYSNSPISEYIGCQIFNKLGVPAQETILGTYTFKGKEKIVVACKDLTVDGFLISDFTSIKNSIIDSVRHGAGTDLYNILESIDEQSSVSSVELKKFFWDMFVIDAFIGNFDRHNGNWGLLVNENLQTAKICPVYDCGSSLFAEMDEKLMKKVMNTPEELNYRTYVIPKSAIAINKKKLNYYDFLVSNTNKDLTKSLLKITSKINLTEINKMIDDIDVISNDKKTFYKFILSKRKELILDRAVKEIYQQKPSILVQLHQTKEQVNPNKKSKPKQAAHEER